MTWMQRGPAASRCTWRPRTAPVTDLDGHEYVDFSLGDTGAMAGHSPAPVVAVVDGFGELGGVTAMLPTEDAAWVAGELTRRFGAAHWSFSLTRPTPTAGRCGSPGS